MLTKADDYPIHQTPDPIAYAGTDRNFYDRFFFNGYNADGSLFFAAAFGVYPHHGIMDGALCFVVDGAQHSVFASRTFHMERMEIHAGPISVDIVEPLVRNRFRVAPNEHGLSCDLMFTRRTVPMEEPRFSYRIGPRTFMDLTRLTQHGTWEGWIELKGKRYEIGAGWRGTRDRSWGVRPIGPSEPPRPDAPPFQFYWQWAPLNFDDVGVLFDVNEFSDGRQWHTNGLVAPVGDGQAEPMKSVAQTIRFKPGTRHAAASTITLTPWRGEPYVIELEPLWNFYMLGIGYGHPEWAHGTFKGPLAVGGDRLVTAEVDERMPQYQHIQAICRARMTGDGKVRTGIGVLEQLIVGAHEPSGFKEILDMAP
jgi:hypothetical protein